MNKREFLGAALAAGALPGLADAAPLAAGGPVLLTISGDIRRPNRGALDPALDQMMAKHKLAFTQAHALDFAALARLPARTIRPTLAYDGKPHTLRGPALLDMLALAGARARRERHPPHPARGRRLRCRHHAAPGAVPGVYPCDTPRRPADGARGAGAAVGRLRCRSRAGHGGAAAERALRCLPLGPVPHRRAGLTANARGRKAGSCRNRAIGKNRGAVRQLRRRLRPCSSRASSR